VKQRRFQRDTVGGQAKGKIVWAGDGPRAAAWSALIWSAGQGLLGPAEGPSDPRARIEQAVGKLTRFKRIALRCEKTAQNYGSFVALALGFILIKSVHTA
jgi:hypothetical protein